MSDIAYQNKDITSKVFADRFKGKQLKVYGINMPEIKDVLPTNLPEFKANELRMDNIFLLEDDTIAIIDYESAYKPANKHKYIDYVNRVLEHYEKEWHRHIDVRMIVIYTADVTPDKTSNSYDVGCLQFEVNEAFLSEIDKEEVKRRISDKIRKSELLTDEEMMEFILLPMAYKGDVSKNTAISEQIELSENIVDEDTKIFVLTGLVVFADKVISKDNSERIRRMIAMTKVGRLFEEEKAAEVKRTEQNMALKMMKDNIDDEIIYDVASYLSREDIKNLRASLSLS